MNFYLYSYFVHVISLIWIYIDFFYRFQELLFKKEMKLFNLYVIFCTPNKIFKMVLLSKQQCLFLKPKDIHSHSTYILAALPALSSPYNFFYITKLTLLLFTSLKVFQEMYQAQSLQQQDNQFF